MENIAISGSNTKKFAIVGTIDSEKDIMSYHKTFELAQKRINSINFQRTFRKDANWHVEEIGR